MVTLKQTMVHQVVVQETKNKVVKVVSHQTDLLLVNQVQLSKEAVLLLKEEQVVVQDISVVVEVQDRTILINQVVVDHHTMVIHK